MWRPAVLYSRQARLSTAFITLTRTRQLAGGPSSASRRGGCPVTTIRGLAEVVLWVHDLPASVAFYRDLLGLPVISPPERTNPIFLQASPGTAGIPAMVVLV